MIIKYGNKLDLWVFLRFVLLKFLIKKYVFE